MRSIDVAQIAVPPKNSAEQVVKFVERHLIGDRDQADDHRAHLAQNRSQNQAFEGGCFNHLSRLLGSPDPQLFGALSLSSRSKEEATLPTIVQQILRASLCLIWVD